MTNSDIKQLKNAQKVKRIFISAGEASGDNLGYALIKSILKHYPNTQIAIIGGEKMESLGYKSVFSQNDIAIMGYFEILSSIFKVKKRIGQTIEFLKEFKPNLYIAIDSRGFNFRVVKGIRKFLPNVKCLNYVSPTIWAYRYKRIFAIKKLFDYQFVLYPFERKYYDEVAIPCTFIGHPLGYTILQNDSSNEVFSDDNYVISLFPGSRIQEIKSHMPIFLEAVKLFRNKMCRKLGDEKFADKLKVFIPTLPYLKSAFSNYDFSGLAVEVSDDLSARENILCRSKIFLTKSGTISLELMRYNTPMIVAHKISKITYFFLKFFIKVRHVSIGNLIANKEIIPELLQENCDALTIAKKMAEIEDVMPNYNEYLLKLQNNCNISPEDFATKVIFSELI